MAIVIDREIRDMLVGESGYAVPWSLLVNEDGSVVAISSRFSIHPQAVGTASMRVFRVRDGVLVELPPDQMVSRSHRWKREELLPVLNPETELESVTFNFDLSARTLAEAVLSGDLVAARALVDYLSERLSEGQ